MICKKEYIAQTLFLEKKSWDIFIKNYMPYVIIEIFKPDLFDLGKVYINVAEN